MHTFSQDIEVHDPAFRPSVKVRVPNHFSTAFKATPLATKAEGCEVTYG